MTEDEIRETLLVEAHALIAQAARDGVGRIGVPLRRHVSAGPPIPGFRPGLAEDLAKVLSEMTLHYPPENVLSEQEESALASMKLDDAERSGIERIIAEACASTLFHFFCLMDAVGSPELSTSKDVWLGVRFAEADGESTQMMLHDAFGESYWTYKARLENRNGDG